MKRLDDLDKKKQADAEWTKEAYVSAFLTRTTRANHARENRRHVFENSQDNSRIIFNYENECGDQGEFEEGENRLNLD